MKLEKIEFENNSPLKINIQSINRDTIHFHEDVTEIILPIKGSIEVKSNFEYIQVQEGDFLFVNNKCIHYIKGDDEAIVIKYYIDLNYFQEQFPYIKNMFFRNSIFSEDQIIESNFDIETKEKFIIYFRNLLLSLLLESINYDFKPETLLDELIHKLVYQMIYEFNWLQFLRRDGDFINTDHLDRYHKIIKYIDDNFTSKITLDEIATQAFISKTYFSHFWKNLSSYSFRERINYERALKSEFLLLNNMTIAEISEKCGFSDVKYYYRSFKKWYGCMPLEHREKCYLFEEEGTSFKYLEFFDIKDIFTDYIDRFLILDNTQNTDVDFPTIVDKHLYLKYYHNIHEKTHSNIPRHLLLNPFKYSKVNTEDKNIVFDWNTLDLLLNLIFDFGFKAQIKISSENIRNDLIYDYINIFIDNCISRYGIEAVKDWDFLINYRDSLIFDNKIPIEDILTEKIGQVNISYFIEP